MRSVPIQDRTHIPEPGVPRVLAPSTPYHCNARQRLPPPRSVNPARFHKLEDGTDSTAERIADCTLVLPEFPPVSERPMHHERVVEARLSLLQHRVLRLEALQLLLSQDRLQRQQCWILITSAHSCGIELWHCEELGIRGIRLMICLKKS